MRWDDKEECFRLRKLSAAAAATQTLNPMSSCRTRVVRVLEMLAVDLQPTKLWLKAGKG